MAKPVGPLPIVSLPTCRHSYRCASLKQRRVTHDTEVKGNIPLKARSTLIAPITVRVLPTDRSVLLRNVRVNVPPLLGESARRKVSKCPPRLVNLLGAPYPIHLDPYPFNLPRMLTNSKTTRQRKSSFSKEGHCPYLVRSAYYLSY